MLSAACNLSFISKIIKTTHQKSYFSDVLKMNKEMNLAFSHEPGTAISCLSIPIILHKEGPPGVPETEMKCGFKIGGGIDQDYRKSPQVIYTCFFLQYL